MYSEIDVLRKNDITSETDVRAASLKASYHELLAPLEQLAQQLDAAQSDAENVLDTFRSARSTIGNLQQVVIGQLGCLNRGYGLTRLPNEILSSIFEATIMASFTPRKIPFLLASVCRQFREVVLSSPQLWRHVSESWRSQDALRVRLLRSQEAGLDVAIGTSTYYRKRSEMEAEWTNTFMALVGVHVGRWRRLKIGGSNRISSKNYETLIEYLSPSGRQALGMMPSLH